MHPSHILYAAAAALCVLPLQAAATGTIPAMFQKPQSQSGTLTFVPKDYRLPSSFSGAIGGKDNKATIDCVSYIDARNGKVYFAGNYTLKTGAPNWSERIQNVWGLHYIELTSPTMITNGVSFGPIALGRQCIKGQKDCTYPNIPPLSDTVIRSVDNFSYGWCKKLFEEQHADYLFASPAIVPPAPALPALSKLFQPLSNSARRAAP